VSLLATGSVLATSKTEEVLVGPISAVGDLDAVAGLTLQAEDAALQIVGMLAGLLPGLGLGGEELTRMRMLRALSTPAPSFHTYPDYSTLQRIC
jgi:hypothetical protein